MKKVLNIVQRLFIPSVVAALIIAMSGPLSFRAQATIPTAAYADPRFGLGYLVVTNYSGVDNTGATDSTAGIQNAINDAYTNNEDFLAELSIAKTNTAITVRPLAVFFPPGTYLISNTLTCYEWSDNGLAPKSFYVLVGSSAGSRPVIKLKPSAPNFTSASSPRMMIYFDAITNSTGNPTNIPNPMSVPNGCGTANAINFMSDIRNIDFDCSSNAGAIGVSFPGAQWCTMENVKVLATNAYAGFFNLPGRGAVSANLEVDGGQYGILHGSVLIPSTTPKGSAGPTIAGLILSNQTTAAMVFEDGVSPPTIAGFNIYGQNVVASNSWGTIDGSMTLLDGQITITNTGNQVAILNSGGVDLYVRNVYVSGTSNLVKSSSTTTTTIGTGTWAQIAEYSYNDTYHAPGVPPNSNYLKGTNFIESDSFINGVFQNRTDAFPVPTNIVNNSGAPPSNLVSEHLWTTFPTFCGNTNIEQTVIVSTNIGFNNTNDTTMILQSNIDFASTNVSPNYNGRVYLPGGLYYITNTLTLHSNTVLIGLGRRLTYIKASYAWQPSSAVTMMTTDNDPTATTSLAYTTLYPREVVVTNDTNYTWFTLLTWQAGGRSVVLGLDPEEPWTATNYTQPRSSVLYTNNGGGQYYMFGLSSDDQVVGDIGHASTDNPLYRRVRVSGTTQPLWFYGYNLEHGHENTYESEFSGASNVRVLSMKKEGDVSLICMTNCTNVAAFGMGAAEVGPADSYIQVLGKSTNILCADIEVAFAQGQPGETGNTFLEAITGLTGTNILWPNYVSLYKRGVIDDSLMFPGTVSPPGTPTGLTVVTNTTYPSMEVDASWNSVSTATGYYLSNSTASGGPYTLVANTTSTAYTDGTSGSLTPGTKYYYVVAAYNSGGTSAASASQNVTLRTNAVPTLGALSNITTNENSAPFNVSLSGITCGANEDTLQTPLTINASSDNTGLIPTPTWAYTSPNTTGTLTLSPVANATGTAHISVWVTDTGGTVGGGVDAVTNTFTVTVNAVGGIGDYRSTNSGNWSTASLWQTNNGSSWQAATVAPSSSSGVITLQSPYNVTNTSSITVDQVVVASGATLVNNSTLTIAAGTGTDLDVSGTVLNTGTITPNTGATIVFENGGVYTHNQNGGTIPASTWSSGSLCNVQGLTSATNVGGLSQSFWHFNWYNPTSGTYNPANRFDCLGALTTVLGNFSITAVQQTATMVSCDSVHPAAANHEVALSLASGQTLNIGGNLNLTNVALSFAGSSTVQGSGAEINLGGNVNLSGTNTAIYASYSGTGHQLYGNINYTNTVSGTTITPDAVASHYFFYDDSESYSHQLLANVTLDLTTSASFIWDFTNFPGSTLKMATCQFGGIEPLDDNGPIEAASQIGNGLNFPIQETNHFEPNATYIYNGTTAQNTGSGLPSTVANLIISNAAGVTVQTSDHDTMPLTAAQLVAVTNMLTIQAGALNISSTNATKFNVLVSGLSGNGSATNGSITISNSLSVAGLKPGGVGTTGTLTLDGTLTFGTSSTATFDLTNSPTGSNDKVVMVHNGSVVGGSGNGTVIFVNALTGTLSTSDYTLIDASGGTGTITGTFSNAPAWIGTKPSNFANYSITISGGNKLLLHDASGMAQLPPNITLTATTSGGGITLNGAGGSAGGQYEIITSTNASAALSSWTSVLTNHFDSSGNFSTTLPVSASDTQRFYGVKSP